MRLSRRGVALAETLVAVTLTALLVGTALGGLASMQRSLGRQVARTTREQTLRAAIQLGVAELRDLAPGAGDVLALAASAVTYRAQRATGLACGLTPEGVLVRAASFRSLRTPAAGRDSLALMTLAGDWIRVPLEGAPRLGACPDGATALLLPRSALLPDPLAAVAWPAPLRVFEVMELRAYQSGPDWWLGHRSISAGEAIQPALGPLATAGLTLTALDSVGGPITAVTDIRQLRLTVRLASGDTLARSLSLTPSGAP